VSQSVLFFILGLREDRIYVLFKIAVNPSKVVSITGQFNKYKSWI